VGEGEHVNNTVEDDRGERGKGGWGVGYIKKTGKVEGKKGKREHRGLWGGVHDVVKHCESLENIIEEIL
jgi:hypothetical protein